MSAVSLAEPVTLRPQLQAATEEEALTLVNRWLHRAVGMALNVERADFDPEAFCWHLPIHLAYGATGSLGIVGDVWLHAATGKMYGRTSSPRRRTCRRSWDFGMIQWFELISYLDVDGTRSYGTAYCPLAYEPGKNPIEEAKAEGGQ